MRAHRAISKGDTIMKNVTRLLIVLCLVFALVCAVSCGGNGDDTYDEHEETLDLDTGNIGEVTAPPDLSDTEPSDNAYINAAPANDEQGWGELTPAPGINK